MQTFTLFSALENVLNLQKAARTNEFFSLGAVSSEEGGHTFGKVVGIEEAIAKHAAIVENQKFFENLVFNSVIQDDRNSVQTGKEVAIGSIIKVESDEFGTEIFGIDVSIGENEQRISANTPFAKALMGHPKGSLVRIGAANYRILSVRSTQNKEGIVEKIKSLTNTTIQDAKDLLSTGNSDLHIQIGMLTNGKNLKIADLLDKIEMIQIMRELYDVDTEKIDELIQLYSQLSTQLTIKRGSIKSNPGFIHIIQQIKGEGG